MSAPAAISGDFATYKHVQGRKILQLVIEVPAEMASAVFAALGTPGSGEAIPVALARLQTNPEPIAKPEAPKERRPFPDLPYSQQAALRCNQTDFQDFLETRHPSGWASPSLHALSREAKAASVVRAYCGVPSRSDIIKGTPAGINWEAIDADFFSWARGYR